jgi:hypothetical protein
MGFYFKANGLWSWIYFNRNCEAGGTSNIRAAQFDVLKAFSEAVKK